MENCPDVLSVGQLISQGYDFIWLSDPANKLNSGNSSVPFDTDYALAGNPNEMAHLITPYGNRIHLTINNRVPYYNDEDADTASEADYELSLDPLMPHEADEVAHGSDFPVSLPAHRINMKSAIGLTDHRQSLLETYGRSPLIMKFRLIGKLLFCAMETSVKRTIRRQRMRTQ